MSKFGVESKKSPIEGLGLFATHPFLVGQKIAPYLGPTTDKIPPSKSSAPSPTYWLEIKPGLWLDGSSAQNPARHANHSCAPNVELVYDDTTHEAWLIAIRDIATGNEITFDYGFSIAEGLFHSCQCKDASCTGRIVAAPLRPALRRHLRFSRSRD